MRSGFAKRRPVPIRRSALAHTMKRIDFENGTVTENILSAVVEEGTVSGAAKVLKMTQPPVSYQMKMLEEELNVQLFFRGTKKITLTEAGKVLYARSGSILKMLDVTKREVVKASQSATIHIGITPSTVLMMLEYIERFSKQYPGIHFDIHEGSTLI